MKLAAVYLAGVFITAAVLFGGGAKINDTGEAIAMAGFCILWPLTWACVAVMTVILLLCGWRGGPIW